MLTFRQTLVSGLPGIALRSAELEVVVVPAAGAKITNLRRLRGREWMWRNPAIPLRPHVSGARYTDRGDSGGWDECFPTVAPCRITLPDGRELALDDHGELWTAQTTSSVYERDGEPTLDTTMSGTRLPFELVRRIRLDRDHPVVHLEYRLRHTGDLAFPWIWAAHPLFTLRPGTRLELPSVEWVRVDRVVGREDVVVGQVLAWPDQLLPGAIVPLAGGWAVKAIGDIGASGRIAIVDPDRGERLEITVDPAAVPQVGLWLNLEGWAPEGIAPYYTMAIEPSIGAPTSLARAVSEWKTAQWLEPGASRRWALSLTLPLEP